jgi:hypothetical protein
MIELLYLDSSRINRQVNVAAHLRALSGIAASAGIPTDSQVVFCADGVRRALQTCRATVLYLLGHSEGSGGMVAGGVPALDGTALTAWLLRRVGCLPRAIVFNTCDAVASGLVNAALVAGVPVVVAANRPIPIDRMCAYADTLLQTWLGAGASLTEATRFANDAFGPYSMRLDAAGASLR